MIIVFIPQIQFKSNAARAKESSSESQSDPSSAIGLSLEPLGFTNAPARAGLPKGNSRRSKASLRSLRASHRR